MGQPSDENRSLDAAQTFFRDMVEPTVAEFLTDPSDKRRGCLACLVVASMTEHYFQAHPDLPHASIASFKTQLRRDNWVLGAIADIANATKHVAPTRSEKWSYADINVINSGQCGILQCGWPIGAGDEVLVGPDMNWRLVELLEIAMDYWRAEVGGIFQPTL